MDRRRKIVQKHFRFLLLAVLFLHSAQAPTAVAESPVERETDQTDSSIALAEANFSTAQEQLKKLVGELTVLQAEYQQPDADKTAIENKFNATRDQARTAALTLERTAAAAVLSSVKAAVRA